LPGHQEDLIRAVATTGRPVVVVLVGGSAVTMSGWLDRVGGVLMAWYPGDEGGRAVADALFGDVNPAGRLPITFPHAEGQLPLVYNHKPTGRGDDYLDLTGRPLFPFGFGLSYSHFEYAALQIAPDISAPSDSVVVTCRVRNAGHMGGDEVVQLYLRDEVASVTRPVMELAGFTRVHIPAGEARTIRFVVRPEQLSLLDAGLTRRVEPGRFRVMVGASSADIRLRGMLTVRETVRE
jgi:beta-glucosidase